MQPLRAADPRHIGPYAVLRRLGAGGMGEVYLAESRTGLRLAVKVVRAEHAEDRTFRARFRHEVSAARTVGGAGTYTARVVDADTEAERPWMATEFVPGPNLRDAVLDHGALPGPAVRILAAALGEALAAIHAKGLVHRDLKPSNILLGPDGPRVIDFGIVRALEATALTRTGAVVGSVGYVSPEQIRNGGQVGPPSDVFSLGTVLAYAAAGREPFGEGQDPVVLLRILTRDVDLSGVPEDIRPLVAACLAEDPLERPEPARVPAAVGFTAATLRAAVRPGWYGPASAPVPAPDDRPSGVEYLSPDPLPTPAAALAAPPAPADSGSPPAGAPGARTAAPGTTGPSTSAGPVSPPPAAASASAAGAPGTAGSSTPADLASGALAASAPLALAAAPGTAGSSTPADLASAALAASAPPALAAAPGTAGSSTPADLASAALAASAPPALAAAPGTAGPSTPAGPVSPLPAAASASGAGAPGTAGPSTPADLASAALAASAPPALAAAPGTAGSSTPADLASAALAASVPPAPAAPGVGAVAPAVPDSVAGTAVPVDPVGPTSVGRRPGPVAPGRRRLLKVLAGGAAVAAGGLLWQQGFRSETEGLEGGYRPPESEGSAPAAAKTGAAARPAVLRWQYDLGGIGGLDGACCALSPDGSVVYAGTSGGALHAISRDGSRRWKVRLGDDVSTPVATRDAVYCVVGLHGDGERRLTAVSPSGSPLWTRTLGDTGHVVPVPLGADVLVPVGGRYAGGLRSYGPEGSENWTFRMPAGPTGTPLVAAGVVYTGSYGDELLALDARDGTRKWQVGAGTDVTVLALVGTTLITHAGAVRQGFRVSDGRRLWRRDAGSGPLTAGNRALAVGTEQGSMYAVRAADGTRAWAQDVAGSTVEPRAVVAGDTVYARAGDRVWALDLDGGRRWDAALGRAAADDQHAPLVRGSRLYVPSGTGVAAVDLIVRG
ncbi:serine/threonine-protein kinase [Streptomyces capoamus]|uniref:serine/threonine-protein kinase n=1 Tax=Streptomyces capoamus TaxID=68183 RepID=UPI00339785DC